MQNMTHNSKCGSTFVGDDSKILVSILLLHKKICCFCFILFAPHCCHCSFFISRTTTYFTQESQRDSTFVDDDGNKLVSILLYTNDLLFLFCFAHTGRTVVIVIHCHFPSPLLISHRMNKETMCKTKFKWNG